LTDSAQASGIYGWVMHVESYVQPVTPVFLIGT